MKRVLQIMGLTSFVMLTGCSYEPEGRWEVTDRIEVYEKNDHPLKVAFIVEKGEVCAVSEKVLIRKDLGYKKVSCAKGHGWVADFYFKKLGD